MATRKEIQKQLEACRNLCEEIREGISETLKQTDENILREISNTRNAADAPPYKPSIRNTFTGHFGKLYSLFWSKKSDYLITASQDGKLIIWDALTGNKKLAVNLASAWVMTCAFSTDNSMVASGGLDNVVTIHKVAEVSQSAAADEETQILFNQKTVLVELEQHDGYVSCARFVNQNEIMSCSGDGTILLWDIENKTSIHSFMEHSGDVMFVSLKGDNHKVFCSGSVDCSVKIWDSRSGNKYIGNFGYHESDVNTVEWFADNNAILSGSDDGSTRLLDMRSFRQLNEYVDREGNRSLHSDDPSGVTSVSGSITGQFFFSSYDNGNVYMWDTLRCRRLNEIPHENRVSSLSVSPNGCALATACWDFNMRVFA